MQHVIGTKAQFVTEEPYDTWAARLDHLYPRPDAQTHLFQAMDLLGRPEQLRHHGTLAGCKLAERDQRVQ